MFVVVEVVVFVTCALLRIGVITLLTHYHLLDSGSGSRSGSRSGKRSLW